MESTVCNHQSLRIAAFEIVVIDLIRILIGLCQQRIGDYRLRSGSRYLPGGTSHLAAPHGRQQQNDDRSKHAFR